jgi:hypothetical protein
MGFSNVNLYTQPQPPTFAQNQTDAQANYYKAAADQAADPRFNAKQYTRGGISHGKGQDYLGAISGAMSYADNMAKGEQARMSDAWANANRGLGDSVGRERYGMALAGLQEQQAQNDYMNRLQMQQQSMNFMGNMFGNVMGSLGGSKGGSLNVNSILSGLL